MSDEVTPEEFEVPSTVEEILDERSESEQQRDEYKDALQRLQADFENYKKRVARTSEEVVTRAVADVVAKLLPVLDALDLAQAHFTNADTSELDSAEAKALIQARGLLLDTLKKEGLDRVDGLGLRVYEGQPIICTTCYVIMVVMFDGH